MHREGGYFYRRFTPIELILFSYESQRSWDWIRDPEKPNSFHDATSKNQKKAQTCAAFSPSADAYIRFTRYSRYDSYRGSMEAGY